MQTPTRVSDRAAMRVAALGLALLLSPLRPARSARAGETSPSRPQPRIVNGVLTPQYPTTGAILYGNSPFDPSDVNSGCSAVLVGCKTLITAAHCICPNDADNASACVAEGLVDLTRMSVLLQHAGIFPVASITLNPSYQFGVGSDIAMITLATPVSGITPSRINTTAAPTAGTAGTIVGFGITTDNATDSGLKRVGKVVTAHCDPPIPNSTNVCWNFVDPVGLPGEDSNTCNGDSGGPLFINFGDGDRVAGLTSGGEPDCQSNSISWDTSVFNDRVWVQTEAGADLDSTSCGDLPQVGSPGTQVNGTSGELSATRPESRSTFEVPAGTRLLRVVLNGADEKSSVRFSSFNDFDLYIRAGSPPTTETYDCKDIGASPFGFCEVTAPSAGTWHVLVDWVEGGGTYQVTATTFGTARVCAGDCNGNGEVTVDELIKGVNIAVGGALLDQCPSLDANGDGEVTVDELVRAVNNALTGCVPVQP